MTTEPTLLVLLGSDSGDGERGVLAPALGRWTDPPPTGRPVGPGSPVGFLDCLNRRFRLIMPAGAAGVVQRGDKQRQRAVDYAERLFGLRPLTAGLPEPGRAGGDAGTAQGNLPRGCHAVYAPTDGIFYRGPSPDAPPFVEVGSRVRRGQPVGLVEVMKTFNQIVYGAADQPETAEVVEVRGTDGAEVAAGEPLVVLR